MSSWLKVAEDLFENVDRRAKLVVSELADEQSASQLSATSGQRNKGRKVKAKDKSQARNSTTGISKITPEKENKNIEASTSDANTDEVKPSPKSDSTQDGTEQIAEILSEHLSNSSGNNDDNNVTIISETTDPETNFNRSVKDLNDSKEGPITNNDTEMSTSSVNNDIAVTNSEDLPETPSVTSKKTESNNDHLSDDNSLELSSSTEGPIMNVDPVIPASENVEMSKSTNGSEKESVEHHESSSNKNKQQETENNTSQIKIQDQLDEAQGLLKSTVSTGQSKEARLSRVCANLSSRLQEYKAENTQLEELLVSERARISSYEAQIKQLQHELSASKLDVERIESNMSAALAAKNAEVESLLGSVDSLKKQASASEEKLASLQENMEAVLRNRDLTEARMMQALREELVSAERRAEEEHAAHNATKMAAVEREVELEHRALEASNALARLQRSTDESTERATELEHKVALLEVECASLTQELQDAEARNRRGQKKSSEEANQILQMQAWQEEVERARQAQTDAEHKLSSLEAELQKVRVEMAGMKRDAEHYSRQEHMELEKRYRELTDLLYHKQTQLETMASEKAAAEFQLEKEARRLQEAQVEAERNKVSRRPSTVWEEDNDIKPLESLPLYHRHLSGASIQLQKAAKMLDTGAVRATRFLWRYPFARIFLLFYLVFVHLFLMHLLHRLQEQADYFSSQELAASMGLRNSTLP